MACEFRFFLDRDLAADRQENGEDDDGDCCNPVALLPQGHVFHQMLPNIRPARATSGHNGAGD